MKHAKPLTLWSEGSLISALAILLFAGCQSSKAPTGGGTTTTAAPAAPVMTTPAVAAPAAPAAPAETTLKAIRVDAGSTNSYTDSEGNVWLPDQGFTDGDVVDRGADTPIANTKDPAIYRTEHYDMTSFSQNVPNGKYTVKLHFAETYGDITGAGQRVFSFNVGGQEFKDFDVFAKAGGAQRADIETAEADVTNGVLSITFTPNIQSPEINGIEIIPAP